ncbi:MAG: zn-dependent hydrolase including glyoxylase [Paenibacillus sp.]|nr:zn-dependent hydrolase including glyoxylase [Paenibacillus sp.]
MSHPVKLIGSLYVVSGDKLTHPWDASAYVITGDEPVLIDCGGSQGYEVLKRNLDMLGIAPKGLKAVYATHGHWDHLAGYAGLKADNPDIQLYIHEADAEQVEQGDPERTAAFLYGVDFPPAKVDGYLRDGERLNLGGYEALVLHTPGHSLGSVSFLLTIGDTRVLIAGDTLWGGFHPRVRSDLEAWSRSLDKLLEYDFDVMSFGHLPPTLVLDAKVKVQEARKQFGTYFNPWFKPFYEKFMY